MNNSVDLDPLSTYNYSGYNAYNPPIPGNAYPYAVKLENYNNIYNKYEQFPLSAQNGTITNENPSNEPQTSKPNETSDIQRDIKAQSNQPQDVKPKVKKEQKGRTSSYWSVKITDENFAFYGCSVCNVNFKSLNELDQHVTVHKGRITSYDLRIKNQIKRNNVKKATKKYRKLMKVVKQEHLTPKVELEIKPEDGYIGNEKASEFEKTVDNDTKDVTKTDENKPVQSDPNTKKEMYNLEKIYKCFACQKQFSLSYYLKLHVRSHTDEKPYTCSVCGQSFITASHLGRHNKRIHLAVKNQCRICFKYFSRFDLLTRHFDKKHPEDKLEGEPYDYNAILPYLNELEDQLKKTDIEGKPKIENLWGDTWPGVSASEHKVTISEPKLEVLPPENVIIEPATITVETQIKIEAEETETELGVEGVELGDELGGDGVELGDEPANDNGGDDDQSDEDYFPLNTWASTPKGLPDLPPSPKPKKSKTDGSVQCDICQKVISSVTYLKVHKRTHTGERPFKCYICNRGFITSSKMNRHVLTHANWDEKDGIKSEVDAKDEDGAIEGEGENDVDKEGKTKLKSALLKKRKRGVKVEKQKKRYQKRPHACEYCHKRFLHLETLQVHKRSHSGEVFVPKCTFCLETLGSECEVKDHEATHTGPKPYLCTICGKTYKKRETMVYHRKAHDEEKKEFPCQLCSKRFTSQCKLQRHVVSHRGSRFVVRYECPVCAHMFHTKYHVQMHLATHQREGLIQEENRNEILAMVLQNARKIPKQPDSIGEPDAIPPDERSRVCNICGEVFQHFYYLEEHLKSHGSKIAIEDISKEEEKKYICPICNKSFKLHYYLKLHSFTHSKEKPFICQQCGKGFITRGKLKRHLETHSGLKKYQCHVCYKFFTRPSYLRIHVRTIHGTQDYNFRLDKRFIPNFDHISPNI